MIVYQNPERPGVDVLHSIAHELLEHGILTDILAKSRRTIRAVGRLGNHGIHRRVDLLLTFPNEVGAATIYWTGNDIL